MKFSEPDWAECSICAEKPGSPELCESCLQNRSVVFSLKQELEFYRQIIEALV